MSQHPALRTCILSQGSEILDGSIQNTNARWLSTYFAGSQYTIAEHITIGDDREHLIATYRRLSSEYDVIISTGGLGPTDDDLTTESIADAFDCPLFEDPTALRELEAHYARRQRIMPDNTRKMVLLPKGAEYIDNPLGSACGYRLNVETCSIYVFPGVPTELYAMIPLAFPNLTHLSSPIIFATFGIAESHIIHKLRDINLPPHAFHATRRGNWLTMYPPAETREQLITEVSNHIGEYLFDIGTTKRSLIDVVAEELWSRNEMIATAESCTAGKLSSWFTSISGSSGYYQEGAIVYSNEAKHKYCGVSTELINTQGAVCKQVAVDLARGIQQRSGAAWGMGITGIAGPGGGSPEKPVGTVHIAVHGHGQSHHAHCKFNGTRDQITDQACGKVVFMLLKAIQDQPQS